MKKKMSVIKKIILSVVSVAVVIVAVYTNTEAKETH